MARLKWEDLVINSRSSSSSSRGMLFSVGSLPYSVKLWNWLA